MDELPILKNIFSEDYAYEYLFPYPLADLYRRYRVSRNPVDRLGYLLGCAEASLKFITALTLSLGWQKTDNKDLLKQFQKQLAKPSFGTWQQILEGVLHLDDYDSLNAFESALVSCVRKSSGGQGIYLSEIRTLVEHRNAYVHGGTMTSDVAEEVLSAIIPSFRRAFRSLSFLTRARFVICEEIRRIRRPACFEAIMRICQGSNPVFPYEIWRLDEAIDPRIPLLISPSLTTAYSLHPLLTVLPEKENAIQHYFYLKQKHDKTYWHTYQLHRENQRLGDTDLNNEMIDFMSGQAGPSNYQLLFNGGKPPVWSLFLEFSVTEPSGYSLLGQIGEGRYGVVHRVLHTGLQELRAMKVLRPEAAQDPRARKRFEIEAQAISKLKGKNVTLDLYEYGETAEGLPYLIMQLAEEGSLEEAMERWGPKSWGEVLDICIACFRSLEVIHRAGILHRDIKLSNILLFHDIYVFCDFGVGRFLESQIALTMEGDTLGTAGYIAPEQQKGHSEIRSDLFSLGICATYLLAGEPVADPRGWLYTQKEENPDFRNALLSIIEPIAENRPPSAAAVVERLAGIRERVRNLNERTTPTADVAAIAEAALQPFTKPPHFVQRVWKNPDGTIFREIPAGEFLMGGTKHPDERPVHAVRVSKTFLLASTLVTNAQFNEFRRATKYQGRHKNFLLHLRAGFFEPQWKEPNAPVVFVSWHDAKEYILWKCEKDDLDYRLPTEAEWEYACRAGTRTVYSWGNDFDSKYFNTKQVRGYPTPVGTFPANDWGLFDMLGNVWEWCEDFKDVHTSEESLFYRNCANKPFGLSIDPVNTDPNPVISRRVPEGHRSVRGGSFFSEPHNCRPANRRGQLQSEAGRAIGFRLALYNMPEKRLITID